MKRTLLMAFVLVSLAVVAHAQLDDHLPAIRLGDTYLGVSYVEARSMPPVFDATVLAVDPDGSTGLPVKFRYLVCPAVLETPGGAEVPVTTRYLFEQYGDRVVAWDDPRWSNWIAWEGLEMPITVGPLEMRNEDGELIYYGLALQAMDEMGAVNTELVYAKDFHNFRIDDTLTPLLMVRERFLGDYGFSGEDGLEEFDIAAGMEMAFTWDVPDWSSSETIAGYRWGVDVADIADPNDPGWRVADYGLTPEHLGSDVLSFGAGIHELIVRAVTGTGLLTTARVRFVVVPVPDPADRLPLLLVDDVRDKGSNAWPDASGTLALDEDARRDARWLDLITQFGTFIGFVPDRDVIDTEERAIGLRDLVNYNVVIWATRSHPQCVASTELAEGGFNWLEYYQRHVGNVLLAGEEAVAAFSPTFVRDGIDPFEAEYDWLLPLIYDTTEGLQTWSPTQDVLASGFGVGEDGTVLGRETYAYRTLGLALIDHAETEYAYLVPGTVGDRHAIATGIKRLLIAPNPDYLHMFGSLIGTDPAVDWADAQLEYPDLHSPLNNVYRDEFYDVAATDRPTAWVPRQLPDGSPMIRPIWHGVTRYGLLLDERRADGINDWPDQYAVDQIAALAGSATFDGNVAPGDDKRPRLDGGVAAFYTYATVATKPSGLPDVVCGFDPTRFDPWDMGRFIYSILRGFGLQTFPAREEVSR